MIKETDLIINPDGSIYHLGLTPDQICENVILVGDPERVVLFEKHFDRVYFSQKRREFNSLMGEKNGKNILVVSTGIGTDNIDIVINELDALLNVDFNSRKVKSKKSKINFLRLGTSGTIRDDIPLDSFVASQYAIGLDSLLHFYQRETKADLLELQSSINKTLKKCGIASPCYVTYGDDKMLKKLDKSVIKGITVTLPGFYGPQARMVRGQIKSIDFIDKLSSISHNHIPITNFEMETSGIYGLSNLFGHKALSLSAIIAQRVKGEFSKNPQKSIQKLVKYGIEMMAEK